MKHRKQRKRSIKQYKISECKSPELAGQPPAHPNQLRYESEYPLKCWKKLQSNMKHKKGFKSKFQIILKSLEQITSSLKKHLYNLHR